RRSRLRSRRPPEAGGTRTKELWAVDRRPGRAGSPRGPKDGRRVVKDRRAPKTARSEALIRGRVERASAKRSPHPAQMAEPEARVSTGRSARAGSNDSDSETPLEREGRRGKGEGERQKRGNRRPSCTPSPFSLPPSPPIRNGA